jgi:hypothetical protein
MKDSRFDFFYSTNYKRRLRLITNINIVISPPPKFPITRNKEAPPHTNKYRGPPTSTQTRKRNAHRRINTPTPKPDYGTIETPQSNIECPLPCSPPFPTIYNPKVCASGKGTHESMLNSNPSSSSLIRITSSFVNSPRPVPITSPVRLHTIPGTLTGLDSSAPFACGNNLSTVLPPHFCAAYPLGVLSGWGRK